MVYQKVNNGLDLACLYFSIFARKMQEKKPKTYTKLCSF